MAVLLIALGMADTALSQRVSYPQLVNRSETPQIFINDIIVPDSDSSSSLMFSFRFNNDFIPFRKLQASELDQAPANTEYYSTLRFSAEVFEGKIKKRNSPGTNTAGRDSWTDTVYVSSFEDTQANKKYASGALSTKLTPGSYNYVLQLSMLQEINERSTQRREIEIPNLSEMEKGEIYLIKSVSSTSNGTKYELINMDDNVVFGKDFTALIRIPNYQKNNIYTATVNKIVDDKENNDSTESLFSSEISDESFFQNTSLKIVKSSEPALILQNSGNFTYAVVKIPSSKFDNSRYKLTVKHTESDKTVSERTFQSYWQDMPASLYNLNIAIDMLKFIASNDEIERIRRGSDKERERKFREFWEKRDPTPNTVYNELMAEYYNRIDHAYKEFGSQQEPLGHESDRGEVYIKFGPPNSKERVFPPGGKTREIWKYPNQTFVFEAVSGFGDFKLIGKR
ncbi:GWxTD domain-containing protein [Gracilimonas sp. Q87]|uniref:GWxTD domain-containing protein n=1 Tax=Gracilimonas sp. Q87 TaxID=3384766 RepID=UPI003983E0FE